MSGESSPGHRSRLRERFMKSGLDALGDYEVLELLLTYAIPVKDTKPAAKELIRRFKSVNGVLNAAPADLCRVPGIGRSAAAFLALTREVAGYLLRERFARGPVTAHRNDVEQYLRVHFGHRRDEYVAALFLDNGNHVISAEVVAEGTVNQCAIYPRAVVEKALACGAASFIIAHNHPGGTAAPSEADWRITRQIVEIGRLLEMPLLDHIIICKESVVSLRGFPRWPK